MTNAPAALPREPAMALNLGLYLVTVGDHAGAVDAYREAI